MARSHRTGSARKASGGMRQHNSLGVAGVLPEVY
jgi:hypothetical protein